MGGGDWQALELSLQAQERFFHEAPQDGGGRQCQRQRDRRDLPVRQRRLPVQQHHDRIVPELEGAGALPQPDDRRQAERRGDPALPV